MKTVAVIIFPGSNCDEDTLSALAGLGFSPKRVWHDDKKLSGIDAVILPGGFSYGDYLRCGAIARLSPIMDAVEEFARSGGKVLGICNGFQILAERGLLPGALLRNYDLHFICKTVSVRVENTKTPFTSQCKKGQILHLPIAHMEGNYTLDLDQLEELEAKQQVIFRYTTDKGQMSEDANPNGSLHHIAGVSNETHNVVGLMPHPERVIDKLLGGEDGKWIFDSLKAV